MNCPTCHTLNKPDAPFCIECGATLSLGNAAGEFMPETAAIAVAVPASVTTHSSERGRRWWLLIAFALLLVAVVGGWLLQRDEAAARNYRQGVAALKEQHWHRAAELLAPLAQRNATAAAQYQTAGAKVDAWDTAYRQAFEAQTAGATAQAATFYRQAEAIEPGYRDAAAKLTLMRQRNPLLVYRTDAGLYLATADGQTLKQLPANGYGFDVLASSADGKLVCYTYNSDYGKAQTRNLVVGDIARGFYTEQRFYFRANFQPRPLDAAFINNGAGLLFVVGGKLGELDGGDDPLELYYFDLVGAAGMVHIGDTHLVARPNIADKYVYYVPDDDASQLYTYALDEQFGTTIEPTDGDVIALARSDTANREPGLLYATAQDSRLHLNLRLFIRPDPILLLDEPLPATATVKLATSAQGKAAMALLGTDKAWLVGGSKASPLLDLEETPGISLADVQFSPDGRVLLLKSKRSNISDADYFLLNDEGKELQHTDGAVGMWGWLCDSEGFYVYRHVEISRGAVRCFEGEKLCSNDYFFVVNLAAGYSTSMRFTMPPLAQPVSLSDGQSLVYAATDGVYLVSLGDSSGVKLFVGATGVWVVGK